MPDAIDDSCRRVLIIAYLFPPIGGGGVQRALKMAKYLVQFGWEVHVLTVEPAYHVSLDPTLLNGLPSSVFIHRTKELSPGKLANVSSSSITGDKPNLSITGRIKKLLRSAVKGVKPYILIPDDQILWFPAALRKGLRIMSEYKMDMIFSTSAPYTNHLVGLYLKRKTNKPWIADFRDPWTQNMHRTSIRWREWLEDRLERMVLRESDVCLTVTPSFAANFKQKFSAEIKRVEVIHNGFDPEDYEIGEGLSGTRELGREGRLPSREVCTFIYTGIFYKERNPRLFLKAIKQLMNEGTLLPDRIRIRFAGVFDYPGY
ncbi:MAG TPA: glycosyltransferase, partial [Bacilli bacterium]